MTPKEASGKENENKVWRNLYPEFGRKTLTPIFSIGDNVGITEKKNLFDKGYTKRWTEEVYKISKIQLIIPVTFHVICASTLLLNCRILCSGLVSVVSFQAG